ncbi:hypothetical protein EXE41_02850 [Halorubrum sp. SD690R]|nr:hypothetical protein EXE41_02850 [Halorubrum sp. SD690R]
MANEPIRPSTPDGTAAQSRPRATTPATGSLGRVAAFDAGALFTARSSPASRSSRSAGEAAPTGRFGRVTPEFSIR